MTLIPGEHGPKRGHPPSPWISPLGDGAWTIGFGHAITADANALVLGYCALLARHAGAGIYAGISEWTPAFTSVTVHTDARHRPAQGLPEALLDLAMRQERRQAQGRAWRIPVCFEQEHAPDLQSLATACSMDPREIVEQMQRSVLTVAMLGFMPGLPYLDGLPARMSQPRRKTPRMAVPARSIAVAGTQCIAYPWESPGGWHLLGRTPVPLFNLEWESSPALLAPGDTVQWTAVSPDAYAQLEQDFAKPGWDPASLLAKDAGSGHAAAAAAPRFSVARMEPADEAAGADRATLEVADPAWAVTVQDAGRPGWRYLGVPLAGARDPVSLALANALAGAPEGAAALELLGAGPALRVLSRPVRCALAGHGLLRVSHARGGSFAVSAGRGIILQPGDTVVAEPENGRPAYLAFSGGIRVPAVLGSRSTYARARIGGLDGRALQRGDLLETGSPPAAELHRDLLCPAAPGPAGGVTTLRVIEGPQQAHFTDAALETFYGSVYRVSPQADRMGLRLEGPALAHNDRGADIASDGITPGAIQVPADGMPIVLMADAQTTGGYAKPCVVIRADLARLGSLIPGDSVRFAAVGIDEARQLWESAQQLTRDRIAGIVPVPNAGGIDEDKLRHSSLISGVMTWQA